MKKYAPGGMPMVMKDGKKVPSFAADGKGKMAKGKMVKMANGGMTPAVMPGNAMGARGLERAAAMSGRTMPTTGKPVGMAKGGSAMQKVATKVAKKEVKGHETKMHGAKKMSKGGGIEARGKTKGKVC